MSISPPVVVPDNHGLATFSVVVDGVPEPGIGLYGLSLDFVGAAINLVDGEVSTSTAPADKITCSVGLGTGSPSISNSEALEVDSGQGSLLLQSQGTGQVLCAADGLESGSPTFVCGVGGTSDVVTPRTGNGPLMEVRCVEGALVPPGTSITVTPGPYPGETGAVFLAGTGEAVADTFVAGTINASGLVGPDTDLDGVRDSMDNCTARANNNQYDSNGDGFGNYCDPDLNGDNKVVLFDLIELLKSYRSRVGDPEYSPHSDLNGDGKVTLFDVLLLTSLFRGPPGPSGLVTPGSSATATAAAADSATATPAGSGTEVWSYQLFTDSAGPGNAARWEVCRLPLASDGAVVNGTCDTSDGLQGSVEGGLHIDDTGAVSLEGDLAAGVTYQQLRTDAAGRMVAGVASLDGDESALAVAVRPGGGHATADLAGTWHAFTYSDSAGALSAPELVDWMLTLDTSGTVTHGLMLGDVVTGSVSVSASGEVALAGELHDLMEPFALRLDAEGTMMAGVVRHDARAGVVVGVREGTPTPDQLEGRWSVYGFSDAEDGVNEAGWSLGTFDVDADGTIASGTLEDGFGSSVPADGALEVDARGAVSLAGSLADAFTAARLQLDARATVIVGGAAQEVEGALFPTLLLLVKH